MTNFVEIGDKDLGIEEVMKLGSGSYKIKLSPSAIERIKNSNSTLMELTTNSDRVIYGVNTGFGLLAGVKIQSEQTRILQMNLVRQSAAGVGEPLLPEQVRRMLLLRIFTICLGFSGTKLETVEAMVDAFNNDCLPFVPEKGSVGASGDLAPLAHLALGIFGEGELIRGDRTKLTARLDNLGPKEGLSLINGTQFITALGAEAVSRACSILDQAIIVAALSVEVLKGIPSAFDEGLHASRRQHGQTVVARRLRQLLPNETNKSPLFETHHGKDHVQDAYSIRCIPQVLGVVYDSLQFVARIIENEINAVTDNPLVFRDRHEVVSGGNFHGQYPAKGMDILAMTVHDIANISERRTERLVNPGLSQNLPPFLTIHHGLHSGYMIAQYTQAALVSENKTLCHPASIDSIPTCANQEDFVSMGAWAARKALSVVRNVEHVVAIELLCACQALDLRRMEYGQSTLTTTAPLQEVYQLVRNKIPFLDEDRELRTEIETVTALLVQGEIQRTVAKTLQQQWSCLTDDK